MRCQRCKLGTTIPPLSTVNQNVAVPVEMDLDLVAVLGSDRMLSINPDLVAATDTTDAMGIDSALFGGDRLGSGGGGQLGCGGGSRLRWFAGARFGSGGGVLLGSDGGNELGWSGWDRLGRGGGGRLGCDDDDRLGSGLDSGDSGRLGMVIDSAMVRKDVVMGATLLSH